MKWTKTQRKLQRRLAAYAKLIRNNPRFTGYRRPGSQNNRK